MTAEENIAVVRAIYEQWAQGNFRAGVELYDPEIRLVQPPGLPDTGTYVGTAAVADYMRGFLEAWSRVAIEAEELTPVGDGVVAAVVQRAVGKGSGAEPTEFRYFQVWTFRAGRVVRLEVTRDRDAAFEAARHTALG
jgi:ketosteroid isomerase-like protein